MRRRAFLAAAGGASAALAGCLVGTGAEPGDGYDVGMGASVFDPPTVTVDAGGTVTWRNTNSRAHTVTAYDRGLPPGAGYFASGGYGSESAAREAFAASLGGALSSGDEYAHAFEVPGEYAYFCIPHERAGMVGRVVVRG